MRFPRIAALPFLAASLVAGCSAQQAAPIVVVLPVAVELALAEASKEAREIGRFGTWTAAQAGYPGRRTCFLSASPSSTTQLPTRIADAPASAAAPAARGGVAQRRKEAVAIVVTQRSAGPERDAVSFRAGWELAPGRDVAISVDGRQVATLARRTAMEPELAHAKDQASGQAIVAALRGGKRLEAVSIGPGNATNSDAFDLAGFAAALDAANAACGLR